MQEVLPRELIKITDFPLTPEEPGSRADDYPGVGESQVPGPAHHPYYKRKHRQITSSVISTQCNPCGRQKTDD